MDTMSTASARSPASTTTGTKLGYQPVHQDDDPAAGEEAQSQKGEQHHSYDYLRRPNANQRYKNTTIALAVCLVVLVASNLYLSLPLVWSKASADSCPCRPSKVPQYFQTSPELWAGPTATGRPAFMAQTRTFDPTATYVPNEPLETSMPIEGMRQGNESIFKLMGYLSPYSPSPGFGVDEYPLPSGAEIIQVQMLSRHGSRYPTTGSNVADFGERIAKATGKLKTQGDLTFLQDWKYQLGAEILVPKGRAELFESGILHNYMYGSLYNPESKLIVRTTVGDGTKCLYDRRFSNIEKTQDRMLKSAENWLAGFFGLEWTKNATIEVIIEENKFNNSLAGSLNCPNAYTRSTGNEARSTWIETYLKNATSRFQKMTDDGFSWTAEDVYAAQTMCPYETVAYGFSQFCDLFTYEEWQGFEYSIALFFSGISGFHSPTGRAIGIGYQQEVIARLKNHTLGYSGSQINITLDSSLETFPLNQSLYFDFSHDTNIISILTAFGLRQFAEKLPTTENPEQHEFIVSHITPFGARLDIEIIRTPQPLSPSRDGYLDGGETKYIHFVLNQRTLPLGKSFPECDEKRKDGWCDLKTFLKIQEGMTAKAQFEHACFGEYPPATFGDILDGVPIK